MTYSDPRIPALVLPDDGSPNPDDFVDVTVQVSNNFSVLSSAAGIIDFTGTAPTTNNFIGRLARNTATGAVYRYTGAAWEIFKDTQWQNYTPVWTTSGGGVQPAVGNGTLLGKF